MSRELDRVRGAIAPHAERDMVDTVGRLSSTGGLFTFRYSSTEIFTQGGNLYVKMKETRYQNGRLVSEECEGTLDRKEYERLVSEAQGYFLNQMAGFMRLLYAPFSARGRRDGE